MMLLRVLSVELLKIRRRMVLFLTVLGPLGVIGLQALNYGLRYDYLMAQDADDLWGGLIGNVTMLAAPTLFMGIAILASMTAGIEHQTHAWKQTLALPVTRMHVFLGKVLLNALLLFASCTLLAIGTAVLGAALGMALPDLPIAKLLTSMYYPWLAAMPFIALQAWLSIMMHNQAVPLTVGIIGMIVSMFSAQFGNWLPYKWVYLASGPHDQLFAVAAGVGFGAVVLAAALIVWIRRDVA